MKGCCEQDLQAEDMKQVLQVMENGDALDGQVWLLIVCELLQFFGCVFEAKCFS